MLVTTAPATTYQPVISARTDERWRRTVEMFLAAVHPEQREEVQQFLHNPSMGGQGLRNWLRMLVSQNRSVPRALPPALIDVYLTDPEAAPLNDCSRCGLVVPVRADRRTGPEGEAAHEYFPTCPHCGGQTGR